MTVERSIHVGPWRVDVGVRPESEALPRGLTATGLARVVGAVLDTTGATPPASIGLTLSDDTELADLNMRHLGETGPTDVLSFPLFPPESFPPHPRASSTDATGQPLDRGQPGDRGPAFALPPGRRPHLGDIVVSVQRAAEQAAEGRGGQTGDIAWSVADELRLLVVHGTLHVCGWDHAEPVEEAAMRALERSLLGG